MTENRRYSCVGKEVRRDGQKMAKAVDESSAFLIAMALNTLNSELNR